MDTAATTTGTHGRVSRLGAVAVCAAGGGSVLAQAGALGAVSWSWPEAGVSALAGVAFLALVRHQPGGLFAGTCASLAARRGWPVWLVRGAVLALAPVLGAGVALYALISVVSTLRAPARRTPWIDWRSSAGVGLLGLAWVIAVRAAGVRLGGDSEIYSALLIGSGLALFWSVAGSQDEPLQADLRTAVGLLLALGGAALVLSSTGLFHQAERTIAGTAVALTVLVLVVGPRWLRTTRLLSAERAWRERAQERAELADHLHDSVLQTLALIQRRSEDPAEVVTLARRQERELREWLQGGPGLSEPRSSLGRALRAASAEVEDAERVAIEVVTVGDAPLDERLRALVAAAREAISNAVRHGAPPVSVFCRANGEAILVYVHDRGLGFDLDAIPSDRRGVRESIISRMERHGGTAEIRVRPEAGCEVVLRMERR